MTINPVVRRGIVSSLILGVCHLGTLMVVYLIAVTIADNSLPPPFVEWSNGVISTFHCIGAVLSFPLLLPLVLLRNVPWPDEFVDLLVVANSAIWGWGLAWAMRRLEERHFRRAAQRGEACVLHPLTDPPMARSRLCGNDIAWVTVWVAVIALLGPIRQIWGVEIVEAFGGNATMIHQITDNTWSPGAYVETTLDLCYYLFPPMLALVSYRRSTARATVVAGAWVAGLFISGWRR